MAYQNKAFPPQPVEQITQGQNYSFTLIFDDDVSGLTYAAELRTAPDATAPVEFAVDMTHAGTDPYSVSFSLTPELTEDLTPGIWVWDVWEIDDANDARTPVAFGQVNVNATVTQIGDTIE